MQSLAHKNLAEQKSTMNIGSSIPFLRKNHDIVKQVPQDRKHDKMLFTMSKSWNCRLP